MKLDTANYHGWQGRLRSPWFSTLAIVKVALLQVFRRKSYWVVIGLGLLQFVVFFAIIYAVTQLGAFKSRVLERLDFVAEPNGDVENNGYLMFMERQSLVVMMLLAFAGSLLVGADFRLKSLPFYLSRRIDRRHYIVGKLLAVSAIVALLTVAPAVVLFVEYGAFTSSFEYWLNNWRLLVSILGYGLVLCTVLSITLVTLSAYLQRTAPIAITWSSLFFMLAIIARQMRDVTGNVNWLLLDPWRDMRYVGRYCFGYFAGVEDEQLGLKALALLSVVCVVCLVALAYRVRAVDVVE
mgnify:FL=1